MPLDFLLNLDLDSVLITALGVGLPLLILLWRCAVRLERAKGYLEPLQHIQQEAEHLREQVMSKTAQVASLEATLHEQHISWSEKLALLEGSKARLTETFHALSSEALVRNNQAFLDLAKTTLQNFQNTAQTDLQARELAIAGLVNPLSDSLKKVDEKIHLLEKERMLAYQSLKQQVTDLMLSQKDLRLETSNLVKALRTPHVRGRWGEMQLKRVVEIAGMIPHCDFIEQATLAHEGTTQRPDMIVRLPGGKAIIIDAKVPLAAYLESLESSDETARQLHLKNHARHVKTHILNLSAKSYWEQIPNSLSAEFVVMFIPGDPIFSAALEQDPTLIEIGVEKKVILATPTTLIALLHAASYGWRQEAMTQNAQEISNLGRELYKRLGDMGGHFHTLGRNLTTAVDSYNKTVGTLERRVLPTARRFKELQATPAGAELEELTELDIAARTLESPELNNISENSPIIELAKLSSAP